jgi:hypothetical protein
MLTVGLVATVRAAQEPPASQAQNNQPPGAAAAPGPFRQGQMVVVVGEITSSPKRIAGVQEEQKMQVGIGPARTDYTLHLGEAALIGTNGQKIEENDLVDKMWIRAEGTVMDEPRRIKVTRLQVIGKDLPGLKRSAFYRPGFDQGYVSAVAGSRQIYPDPAGAAFTPAAVVIVGQVSDDTGALEATRKVQVDAAGNTWTMAVPKETPVFDTRGEKISVHEISKGQWIRAHGWQTDDLRLRAARVENIGPAEAYRANSHFRMGEPLGYVEREPGAGIRFTPLKLTAVVTAVDPEAGVITLRDDSGKERVIAIETVTVTADGKPADLKALQKGQRVTVEGSEIVF